MYTAMDEYFILFISEISVFGTNKIYLQAHAAQKSATGNFLKNLIYETELDLLENRSDSIVMRQGSILFDASKISLVINCAELSVDLSYTSPYPVQFQMNPFFIEGRFGSQLFWKPLLLHGIVNGNVRIGEINQFTFRNENGYADLVESSFLPFALPVDELFWGRLHSDELDLSFTVINKPLKRKKWSKVFIIWKGIPIEFDVINLVIHEQKMSTGISLIYPEKYTIAAENADYHLTLEIYSHDEAVSSDFIGDSTMYGKITTQLIKFLSRSPKGLKSVAKANILISNSLEMKTYNNLTAIDEYVCFAKN